MLNLRNVVCEVITLLLNLRFRPIRRAETAQIAIKSSKPIFILYYKCFITLSKLILISLLTSFIYDSKQYNDT